MLQHEVIVHSLSLLCNTYLKILKFIYTYYYQLFCYFQFGAIKNNAAIISSLHVFCCTLAHIIVGYTLQMELLSQRTCIYQIYRFISKNFPKQLYKFTLSLAMHDTSNGSISATTVVKLFHLGHFDGCVALSIIGFKLIFP